jgi:3D (Asp-Asp-Asp) domain-containing protein
MVVLGALGLAVLPPCDRPTYAHQRGNSTAYCLQGRGGWVHTAVATARAAGHQGMVAVPRPGRAGHYPMGTVLVLSAGPAGAGTYVVGDRIGRGSQVDFAMPGDCRGARLWGRRTVAVTQAEGMPQPA